MVGNAEEYGGSADDDLDYAVIVRGDDTWHDGPSWYYSDAEYTEEGSVGAFATREEAVRHAQDAGYTARGDR